MIVYTNQKSKVTKKQRAAREALLKEQRAIKRTLLQTGSSYTQPKAYVRETPKYPSLETFQGSCTKPIHGKVYTGTAMKGIGTLHKSNAVPIFTDEEARDQASMRR